MDSTSDGPRAFVVVNLPAFRTVEELVAHVEAHDLDDVHVYRGPDFLLRGTARVRGGGE